MLEKSIFQTIDNDDAFCNGGEDNLSPFNFGFALQCKLQLTKKYRNTTFDALWRVMGIYGERERISIVYGIFHGFPRLEVGIAIL